MKPGTGKFPDPVDFGQVVRDIRCRIPSLRKLAEHTGIARASLYNVEHGAMPTFAAGERLIWVWSEIRGEHATALPRKRRPVHSSQKSTVVQDLGRPFVLLSARNAEP